MTLSTLGFSLARPLLHRMDAETAHGLTIALLKTGLAAQTVPSAPALHQTIAGLDFPNPVGLAAGFDKNAEVPDAMLGLGFGFVEVGTVTPRPQAGNPRPRLFRLTEDEAVINRMGFNNDGHGPALQRLEARKARGGLVGVNLGANKDADDRMADYVAGIAAFAHVASFFTINISSPNTPGLRGLQSREELQELLDRLNAARAKLARPVPMFLKVAPDLRNDEMEDIVLCCAKGAVDALIVSNTTLARPPLRSKQAKEQGGLSGKPLFAMSTSRLANFFLMSEGKIPLIGVGGIHDADTAWTKIRAGASLIELYSALVYGGPQLVAGILSGLQQRLKIHRLAKLSDAVGADAHQIAEGRYRPKMAPVSPVSCNRSSA